MKFTVTVKNSGKREITVYEDNNAHLAKSFAGRKFHEENITFVKVVDEIGNVYLQLSKAVSQKQRKIIVPSK